MPLHRIAKAAVLGVVLACGAGCAAGHAAAETEPPAPAVPPETAAPEPAPAPGPVRVIAVGDIMMGTRFPSDDFLNPDLTPETDLPGLIGADLAELLRSGDVVFGNLEGTLLDAEAEVAKDCANPETCYAFRSPEWHARALRDLGFTVVSMANNHSGDFGDPGRAATMAALDRNGIAHAGVNEPGLRTASLVLANATRVGVAAFAPNKGAVGLNDLEQAERIVRRLARDNDLVLVSFHGGGEGADHTRVPRTMEIFHGEWRGDVYRFAHRVIDAGADAVIGHGPHVARGVEIYKGRLIAYSLGNFWTYGRFNLKGPNGVAPLLEMELAPDGTLKQARVHSVQQVGWGVPNLDPQGRALKAVAELTNMDFPEAKLSFAADGTVSGPGTDLTTPPPAEPEVEPVAAGP